PAGAENKSRYLTHDGVHMNSEGNVLMAKGCLAALGMNEKQIKEIETAWLTQEDTALLSVGNFDPRARIGITLGQSRALGRLAAKREVDIVRFTQDIWFRALSEVVARHADDAVL